MASCHFEFLLAFVKQVGSLGIDCKAETKQDAMGWLVAAKHTTVFCIPSLNEWP